MSADRIEITKQCHGQLRIGRRRVFQDNLDHIFCPAVRIGASADSRRLLDRHLVRRAVNRRGRAENDVMTTVFFHGFEQCERRIQVVSIIRERLFHRFADRLVARKMNDNIRLFLFKKSFQRRFIRNVDPIKREILSDNRFQPVQNLRLAVGKIVRYHNVVTKSCNLDSSVRTDIPRASCKQYFHNHSSSDAQNKRKTLF